jgi:hypothetical protein
MLQPTNEQHGLTGSGVEGRGLAMINGMTEYALAKLVQERRGEMERVSRERDLVRGIKGKSGLVATLLLAMQAQR